MLQREIDPEIRADIEKTAKIIKASGATVD